MRLISQDAGDQGFEALCEEKFRMSFPEAFGDESHVAEALRYCLRHPGGMIRSRLCFQACQIQGFEQAASLNLATGIEYLHTASLIFDDLPCMDDAAMRRGFPTVHSLYSEDSSLLAALAMINRGYSLLWQGMQGFGMQEREKASKYVDHCLGIQGILGGQSRDLHMKKNASAKEVMRVANEKTVSLLKLSLVLPSILSGSEDVRELERLALYVGLAYQVMDDLKDVMSTVQGAGKTVRQDQAKGRPNIAISEGLASSEKRMSWYLHRSETVIKRLVEKDKSYVFLASLRKHFDKSAEKALMPVDYNVKTGTL